MDDGLSLYFRFGIDVIGFSADGDPRLLSSMRAKVKFNLNELTEQSLNNFFINFENVVYIQDTIHVATKLRNRLLKHSIMLPIGERQISVAHIKILLSLVDKGVHGLVLSDICPEDRQNFQSYEKITQPRVLAALEKYVFGSEGTVMYLKICEQITSSFLNLDLRPIERVYRIWNSVYFLRAWRKWLLRSKYKIIDHFISANAYSCIELNAHGLIYALHLLRNSNRNNMFLPHLMASQPCEHLFRHMRSMGTANYTKINFSLYELFHMISRVELTNEIIHTRVNTEGTSKGIFFPRSEKVLETDQKLIELPSNQEIIEAMKNAQSEALKYAVSLGIKMKAADVISCELLHHKADQISDVIENESEESSLDDDEDLDANACSTSSLSHSKFIDIQDEDGSVKTIKKSTFIWMLTESKGKLSSDRLKRVQETNDSDVKRRKLHRYSRNRANDIQLMKSDEASIGNWCFFKRLSSVPSVELLSEENILENCMIGCIVGFRCLPLSISNENLNASYLTKNEKRKSKTYSSDFAPTSGGDNNKGIQALASWYVCCENGQLQPLQDRNHFFIDMDNYIATIENMSMEENNSKKAPSLARDLIEIRSLLYKYYISDYIK